MFLYPFRVRYIKLILYMNPASLTPQTSELRAQRYLHGLNWLLAAGLYTPVFIQLYQSRWETIDYTHAYFILPVSLLLVWTLKDKLKSLSAMPSTGQSMLALGLIILGVLTFAFGWKNDYLSVSTISLIPLLFGLSIYLYGSKVAKILAFPILYLLFLVPPPLGILDAVTLPMRYGVSVVSEKILHLLNYPISREGLLLSVGGHQVFLGEACSGFRSLVTLSALGLAYIYLSKGSTKKRTIMALSIIPLTLIGNLIRVVSVCLVTYYIGESVGQRYYHDISGFVIFLFMIIGLLIIENRYRE